MENSVKKALNKKEKREKERKEQKKLKKYEKSSGLNSYFVRKCNQV